MGLEKQNLGEIYAARVFEKPEIPISSPAVPKIREVRDMVYSGGSIDNAGKVSTERIMKNRKTTRRRISPFTIILILIGTAIASVLYIGNILMVGRLMAQINRLQIIHQRHISEQELLKSQINRLSSLERIQQIARDQLGMQNSKNLPQWIEVNPERIRAVEEIVQEQVESRR